MDVKTAITKKQQLREKADRYRKALDDGLLMRSVGYFSHADIHISVSDKKLMDRLLTDVTENSTFETRKIADEYMHESMYSKMDDIVEWLDNADFGERKAFDAYFEDESIGHGFVMDKDNRTIQEYTTSTIRMVLKQDNTNQYGFSLITAYPSMITPDIQPTGRDLTPIIQQTDAYKNASPIKKAYLEYRGNPTNNKLVTYKQGNFPADDHITVHIPTNNPNMRHLVRIKENGSTIITTHDKEPVESEFTALRDMLYPHHKGKPTVYLGDDRLKNVFSDTYPEHAKIVDNISQSIQLHISDSIKNTKTINAEEKHATRVAQATHISDNITYDDLSSTCDYPKP